MTNELPESMPVRTGHVWRGVDFADLSPVLRREAWWFFTCGGLVTELEYLGQANWVRLQALLDSGPLASMAAYDGEVREFFRKHPTSGWGDE